MDPWLERPGLFPDVHESLIFLIREALTSKLPEPYYARIKTRVWIEDTQRREPDVSLKSPTVRSPSPKNVSQLASHFTDVGMVAVAIENDDDPIEEGFLEICSADGDRLVTAIEVLSLSNKSPGNKGRKAYLKRQAEYLESGVGLVEVDLLRDGRHTTAVSLSRLRSKVGTYQYHICVSGSAVGRQRFIAPIRLSDRLPSVPVPLDPDVPPVTVNLQPLLDRSYESGGYGRHMHYELTPEPPLTPDQQTWAETILRAKGILPPVTTEAPRT